MPPFAVRSVFRPALCILALAFASGATTTAAAQTNDDAPPAPAPSSAPHVFVTLDGPEDAALEERLIGQDGREGDWITLCSAPCRDREVTIDPYAEHHIEDRVTGKTQDVAIFGRGGAHVVVRYERQSPAKVPLVVGGGAVFAIGGLVLLTGVGIGLSNIHIDPGSGVDSCPSACETKAKTANTLLAVGGVTLLVGGALAIAGLLTPGASATELSPRRALTARATPRLASWSRPELPAPPAHATLLDIRF